MKATVHITLKNGVLDPQGKAIEHALKTLGFDSVAGATKTLASQGDKSRRAARS